MNESRHIVNSEALTAKNRRSLRPSDLEAFGGDAPVQLTRFRGWSALPMQNVQAKQAANLGYRVPST